MRAGLPACDLCEKCDLGAWGRASRQRGWERVRRERKNRLCRGVRWFGRGVTRARRSSAVVRDAFLALGHGLLSWREECRRGEAKGDALWAALGP